MAIASEKKETAVNLIPDKLNSSYSQGHMSVIFPRIPLISYWCNPCTLSPIQGFFKRQLDGNEAKSFRARASDPVILCLG
jgi:hypothetical protein